MKIIANVKVGRAKVRPDTPTHVPWVREGNKKHSTRLSKGLHVKKDRVYATASRSTGVNALFRNSIVPKAPRLTPM
jgi:hypothetical protein